MSFANKSPWIEQLDQSIEYPGVSNHSTTDIVVVGAGIAGVSTAYQILTQTDLTVTLLEAKKVARGASGHNGGQVVLYFEKPFREIVSEYGLEKAIDGQKSLFDGFDRLVDMAEKVGIRDQIEVCTGYMGIRSMDELVRHLENKYLRDSGGAQFDAIFVDKNWSAISEFPEKFQELVSAVDQSFIAEKLQTNAYFPVMLTSRKACMNSALFCQHVIQWLIQKFSHRFSVHEHSPVSEIRLYPDRSNEVWVGQFKIAAIDVVLCTNGFENFHIVDLYHANSRERDKVFHKNVSGLVGYMGGFIAPHEPPSAISYYPEVIPGDWRSELYFYVTSRTLQDKEQKKSLVCVGGPYTLVPTDDHYDPLTHDPREYYDHLKDFMKKYRTEEIPETFPYAWHGLMGYTHTGLRYIGQDPHTPHLWYNLGCNGAGLVSSAYGGWKIAKILSGTVFPSSIFDPQ